jgi:hypothetical protein
MWRQRMRFRYIDIRTLSIVGVFENTQGKLFYWTIRQIKKRIKYYKQIGDWDAVLEFKEALDAVEEHSKSKPWWKFW